MSYRDDNVITRVIHQVSSFIDVHGLIRRDDKILVGVSGGADSMALLSILATLRQHHKFHFEMHCVHFDHGLRPDDAYDDRVCVQQTADALSIPCYFESLPVTEYAGSRGLSTETAARECRMTALLTQARLLACGSIALGHHQDDNAETLIDRMSRGTGFRGLAGIWPVRMQDRIRFIRPLLTLTRRDIMAYLRGMSLSWREDHTNADCRFRRNYIRHKLFPGLSSDTEASLVDMLSNLSLSCYRLYHRQLLPRVDMITARAVSLHADHAVLSRRSLQAESPLVLVELFRQTLQYLGCGEQTLADIHYKTLLMMIHTPTRLSLPRGFQAISDERNLILYRREVPTLGTLPREPVSLHIPGKTIFGPFVIEAKQTPVNPLTPPTRHEPEPGVERFDMQKIAGAIHARIRRPGDRFRPLGKTTPQKVGKFISRAGCDFETRKNIFLICDNRHILWVCPIRMSETAKISPATKEVLELRVRIERENAGRSQRGDECR